MSRFLVVFTIILLICIIVGLCGILIFVLRSGNNFDFSFRVGEEYNKILEKDFDIESINNLNVKYTVGNVYIKNSQNNEVKVIIYGKENDEVKCEVSDKTLYIEDFYDKELEFWGKKRKVEVFLPAGFSNVIDCDTTAGNIDIEDFESTKLNINTKAGNVKVGNAELAVIKTDAGNVKVNKISDLKIETKAGNINVETISKKCIIKNNAGNIKISNLMILEDSSIESDLGNVNIDNTNNIHVQSKNDLGRVKIENNNTSSNITLYVKTNLGNIHVK